MKYIFLLALIGKGFLIHAETKFIKQVRLFDTPLQLLIASSKSLHYLEFNKFEFGYVMLRPDSAFAKDQNDPFKYDYDLKYLGHKYIFEKKFGIFPEERLLRIIDSLKVKVNGILFYSGRIYADSISITISCNCADDIEEKIFYHIPDKAEYPGGQLAFQKYIGESMSHYNPNFKNDTAFFFKAILKKDSLLYQVALLNDAPSAFTNFIQNTLSATTGWKPLLMGGRAVSKYLQIFIRIRNNGVIEADYF